MSPQEEIKREIEDLYKNYKNSKNKFLQKLQYWLYSTSLLKNEGPEIIDEICEKVQEKIAQQKISDITVEISKIVRNKLSEYRKQRGVNYDPHVVQKLMMAKPESLREEYISDDEFRQISPLSRVLLGLENYGIKKIEIAKMMRISPAQVTKHFKKARQEKKEAEGLK